MTPEDERKISEQYPDWRRTHMGRWTHRLGPRAPDTGLDSLAIIRRLDKVTRSILSNDHHRTPRRIWLI